MSLPDRAGSVMGSSPAAMVEAWRTVYEALVTAERELGRSDLLHARDWTDPKGFAEARVECQRHLAAIRAANGFVLGMFMRWDGGKA